MRHVEIFIDIEVNTNQAAFPLLEKVCTTFYS